MFTHYIGQVHWSRKGWGYARLNDRYRDIRVDDHERPIEELRRVYELHKQLFPPPAR